MNLSLAKTIFKIRASSGANGIIYFLKKIPLIKLLIPDSIYSDLGTKTFITGFFTVVYEIFGLIKKSAYLAVLVAAVMLYGSMGGSETSLSHQFIFFRHIFFMMSCVAMYLTESTILAATREKYIAIRYMRVKPKEFVLATFPVQKGLFFLEFLFPLIVVTLLSGGSVLDGLSLFLALVCFRITGEALHLFLMHYLKKALNLRAVYVIIVYVVCMAIALAPIAIDKRAISALQMIYGAVFGPLGIVLMFIFTLLSLFYIYVRYRNADWQRSIMLNLKQEYLVASSAQKNQAAFRDVVMKEEDLHVNEKAMKSVQKKTGYSYLNALFFKRHRRLLFIPILIRLGIIAALTAGGAFIIITNPGGEIRSAVQKLPQYVPMLVFVMYFVSVAGKATKAMFYNCDNSMLTNSFYRKPDVIIKNFNIRILYVAGYNLIVAAAMCLGFMLLTGLAGGFIFSGKMLILYCSVLILSIFFSIHYMFLYYVMQPYTSDLTVKNPVYTWVNAGVYMLSFLCYNIGKANIFFTLVIIGGTGLYSLVAVTLIYKLSPKYFRVK